MSSGEIGSDIRQAATLLRDGGVIGMPTETVYGLAALASDEEAVRRVFDIKGRPYNHPLIVHLSPTEDLSQWGHFNSDATALAQAFWPGPLTLLVPRTARVSDWVTGGRDTVAIRVPNHPVAESLLELVSDGVVAPSANLFGKVSPTEAKHVFNDLGKLVDYILDGGSSEHGVESTIVECIDTPTILRPGSISKDDIEAVLHISMQADTGESRAPGMLTSHYAPNARVVLVETIEELRSQISELSISGTRCISLHFDSVQEYAFRLYASLRQADETGVTVVVALLPPDQGLGVAIRDRLRKASH
ncbi:MAG: L-threonylcarbamoyladenylate synthase [Actinobacteria bacterium]|nr:L-threonylcarbamoyladenylate synthase [Actinomycetota bacterium]